MHINEYLQSVKTDLAQVQDQHSKISRLAHRNSGISLGIGFLGCVA